MMSNRSIRIVIVLAVISILGIVSTQVYWVMRTLSIKEQQLDQSVTIALQNVSADLAKYYMSTPNPDAVQRVSSDFYFVSVNNTIQTDVLEHYLKTEFQRLNLKMDFEYGIYDCTEDRMKYGSYIQHAEGPGGMGSGTYLPQNPSLPKLNNYVYYFGVRLPSRTTYLTGQMTMWVYSSILIVLVVGFFGYTLALMMKQKRLSEVQKDFVNTMTHEFMTPISSISIAADVLAKPEILANPQRHATYATLVQQEVGRLRSQVEKVLQHARLQKHGTQLKLEPVSMDDLLTDIASNFRPQVQEQHGQFRLVLEAKGMLVKADRTHLSGIVYNLLDNALKYSGEAPDITLSLKAQGNGLVLAVADKGLGIAKECQKKIFDRFYRQPGETMRNIKGFGLGLNYVQLIVKAHRWRISLQSELGNGSTFSLQLPALQPAMATSASYQTA